MNASEARNKANNMNSKSCEDVILMIDDASEKGEYSLKVKSLTDNQVNYFRNLGFNVIFSTDQFKISW